MNLLKFRPVAGVCYKTPYISWLLLYLFGAAPQRSPQEVHQIKYNSQLLGCAFFSVDSFSPEFTTYCSGILCKLLHLFWIQFLYL